MAAVVQSVLMTPGPDGSDDLIVQNLVKFREELGLSQRQLADRIGMPLDTYRKHENGTRGIKPWVLKQLADQLGHLVDHFYLPDPPPHDPDMLPTPTMAPAFELKTLSNDVDADLRKQAEEFLAKLNREHLERLRALKQSKRKK
jgi:transcriptional regulator with XRE-family HTH domain